jgi:hypothetical protein
MSFKITIEKCQELAKNKDGKLKEGQTYINVLTDMEWICNKNHKFKLTVKSVKRNIWCNICKEKDLLDIYYCKYKEIIENKGWTLLSEKYINCEQKLDVNCDKEHKFSIKPYLIKKHLCFECRKAKQKENYKLDNKIKKTKKIFNINPNQNEDGTFKKYTIAECINFVKEKYNGKCKDKKYVNSLEKMSFICEHNHEFQQKFKLVKAGKFCKICKQEDKQNKLYNKYKEISKKRGWMMITDKYIDSNHKLEFLCKQKHKMKILPYLTLKYECPTCYKNEQNKNKPKKSKDINLTDKDKHTHKKKTRRRWTLQDCKDYVKDKGECLSSSEFEYIKKHDHLEWKCNACSHIFKCTFNNITKGRWCPHCADVKRQIHYDEKRKTIDDCKELCIGRNIELISTSYKNATTPLEWKCTVCTHIWKASYDSIRRKSGCPQCNGHLKLTLGYCKRYVKDNFDGEIISDIYINSKSKLIFKCKNEHIFKKIFNNVHGYKQWCPTCNICSSCNLWKATPKTHTKLCEYCKPKNKNKLYRKTKEYKVVKFLKENLPDHDFIHNKSVGSHCTKDDKSNSNGHLFPDILFDCGMYYIVVSIDEHKHRAPSYKCEEQRMRDIVAKLGLPTLFIRYNPDHKDSDKNILLKLTKEYLNLGKKYMDLVDDYGLHVKYLFYQ